MVKENSKTIFKSVAPGIRNKSKPVAFSILGVVLNENDSFKLFQGLGGTDSG